MNKQGIRGASTLASPINAAVFSLALVGILIWFATQLDKPPAAPPTAEGSAEASTAASDKSGADSNAPSGAPRPLVVYCAAALKKSVERLAKQYEQESGRQVQLSYGPSQTLLANLEVSRTGDLYLPADDSYLELAATKQLIREQIPIATMTAVLAVPRGNPKQLGSLQDVFDREASLSLANPDAAAISSLLRKKLSADGTWDKILARTKVQKPTVTEIATDVGVGAVDASIVWDVIARDFEGIEGVTDTRLAEVQARVAVSVLESSAQPTESLRFARYLAASDRGLKEFGERGYRVEAGDPWHERPELVLYAGSMLRPAIEETVTRFEAREGVRVTRVYNGCGILVAEMKAGRMPDAYFACDREFMDQVRDNFPDSADVATNQLVILVPKGNPRRIRQLADLSQAGLRVGIGHEKQCAMGWLTQKTFREAKLTTEVMKNVVVQTPTGDMLVNQMLAGSLDVAVAYLSNAVNNGDKLDAIAIENLPCAIAVQPFGMAKGSEQKQLTSRLFAALQSTDSRQRFVDAGFSWNGDAKPSEERTSDDAR